MKSEMSKDPGDVVGKYFHSANENNKVEWQGMVIGEPHPGWYSVQRCEWASGEPKVQRLVPIEKIVGWLYYPDARAITFGSRRSQYQIMEAGEESYGRRSMHDRQWRLP